MEVHKILLPDIMYFTELKIVIIMLGYVTIKKK